MNILTFDLETENHILNKRKASPFDPRNYIVQIGWSINGGKCHERYYTEYHRTPVLPDLTDIDMLVGFNIKFDLAWVWKEPQLLAFLKKGGTIYCGQYAEYLLGGMTQDVQMISMNAVIEQYGGSLKIDAVKEMWENGLLTSQIPRDLLTDYLIGDGGELQGDVNNTWLIFLGQLERFEEMSPEFKTMYKMRMDGLLATTEMEHNGMYVDQVEGEHLRKQLVIDIATATTELEEFLPELPKELKFNWGSYVHKSCLIFGGTVRYKKWLAHTNANGIIYAKKTEKHPLFTYNGETQPIPPSEAIKAGELYVLIVPEGTQGAWLHNDKYYITQNQFKGGKQKGLGKTKNVQVPDETKPKGALTDHYYKFLGYVKPLAKWKSDTTDAFDEPLYSTAAEVIEELATYGLAFTEALIKRTSLAKDLSTYYWTEDKAGKRKGMLTLVDDNGIIHHKLNHVTTVTSRMSSSDPNLQTLPREGTSEVKRMFKSRFGELGLMAEIDYSQLEVVIQGVLSKDVQLRKDLNNKVDFHCKRLSAVLNEDYQHVWDMCHKVKDDSYKKQRTGAKVFSFRRAYGAGAKTIADGTGLGLDVVEALIRAEERMYPDIVKFDNMLERAINHSRIPIDKKLFLDGVAFSQGEGHWDSPTGTRYVWRENITPVFMHKKGKFTGFSPTERKNYPVQGFGGEIMQTMLGKVFRYFLSKDMFDGDVLMVNTVHDCMILDGVEDVLPGVATAVQELMETVPQVFNQAYSDTLDIDVPFPAEAEVGRDLYAMEGI